MARFDIISKDGSVVRYSGKPRYNGAYLKPSYLEFSDIASPTPISWEVGDYVDYSRTGMRYYLYSIPQISKNARKGSHGGAFTYSNVKFHAATKELEIALFRDLVDADNNIHFSSSPDVSTFENVEGIARRIQACMDDFYPGRWEIRIADFDATADDEIIKKIGEAKEFALSGGTCLDALSKIYELWQDIGWVHTNEGGKEVIIIGYPNKRIDENSTESFLYGKGNGLTAIKKNQTNNEQFATRLYVYGSERNLPPRYYNGKDILNAESVDIRNLMIPLDYWGKTDGLPDARKAYLENAEAVAKYGVIPKTHYFDSDDAGADIYPSITGMTIGMIRTALEALGEQDSSYYPSEDLYPDDTQRVDLVRYCANPTDDGSKGDVALQEITALYAGKQRTVSIPSGSASAHVVDGELLGSYEFTLSESKACKVVCNPVISGYVVDDGFESVEAKLTFKSSNSSLSLANSTHKVYGVLKDGNWHIDIPSISYDYVGSPRSGFPAYIYLTITVKLASGNDTTAISYVLNPGVITFSLFPILDKTFLLRLHEIGFNINAQASLGKGKAISMKTGMCAGRTFLIESCRHKSASGYWDFTVKRQQDNTLGLVFPNKDYQIVAGDEFVLLDIAMPELYILANSQRLLSEGEKLLARASKIQNSYEPSIDAKVMAESERTLREGMFMEITDEDVVDNTTDYILIDTLSIYEDEGAIPSYKVTLKERRKVEYKGTPSATSSTETESVEDSGVSSEVDLTGYATEDFVNERVSDAEKDVKDLADLLASMWYLDDDGNVRTKHNVVIEGDTSSGGEGEDTPASGITQEELTQALGNYYTKTEVNELIDGLTAGDANLTNYYTKNESDLRYQPLSTAINTGNIKSYNAGGLASVSLTDVSVNDYLSSANRDAKLYYGHGSANVTGDAQELGHSFGMLVLPTASTMTMQLMWYWDSLHFRTYNPSNGWYDWKKIAFTTSTVAASLKLAGTYISSSDSETNPLIRLNVKDGKNFCLQAYDTKLYVGAGIASAVSITDAGAVVIPSTLSVNGPLIIAGKEKATAIMSFSRTSANYIIAPTGGTINFGVTGVTGIAVSRLRIESTHVSKGTGVDVNLGQKDNPWTTIYGKDGNFTGDVVIEGNLIVKGDTSSGGESGETGTAIGSMLTQWTDYNASTMSGYVLAASLGYDLHTRVNSLEANGALSFTTTGSGNAVTSISKSGTTVTVTKGTSFLPLTGGTIGGTLTIKRSASVIRYTSAGESIFGWLGFDAENSPVMYQSDGATKHTLIHSGNIGNQSVAIARKFRVIGDTTGDLNTILSGGGLARNYSSGLSAFTNAPSGASYGMVLELTGNVASSLAGQLAWDVNHGSTSDVTRYLWWRASDSSNGFKYGKWHQIAFTDSNVASATKLATARTIWGQSFDGTGNVDGTFTLSGTTGSTSSIKFTRAGWSYICQTGSTGVLSFNIGDTGVANSKMYILNNGHVQVGVSENSDKGYNFYVNGTTGANGNITSVAADDSVRRVIVKNSVASSSLYVATSGNRGIYDDTNAKWMIYSNGTMTYMPYNDVSVGGSLIVGGSKLKSSTPSGGSYPIWCITRNTSNVFLQAGKVDGTSTAGNLYITGINASDLGLFAVYAPNSYFKGNVCPKTGNTYNLGASSYMWSTTYTRCIDTASGYILRFKVAGTEYMNLSTAGNLCIGNGSSTGSEKLHVYGNAIITGDTSTGSDIRFKNVIKDKTIKIADIAKAPLFTFKWNDREDDVIHLGSSAQYWEKVCPWLVTGEDFKSLNYATLGVAMGISLAKKAVNHEERIKELEKEIKRLKEEMRYA